MRIDLVLQVHKILAFYDSFFGVINMKYETIYTIPVNDAVNVCGGCPICRLYANRENELLDYYLGPSLMEADVRQESNKYGFCHKHLSSMYNSQKNRLGLSLILYTHLQELQKNIDFDLNLDNKRSLFNFKNNTDNLDLLVKQIDKKIDSCLICKEIDKTVNRYLDVIFYMYFNDEVFKQNFIKNSELCLTHMSLLINKSKDVLNNKEREIFVRDILEACERYMNILEKDIKWFSDKFDYRNKDKSWLNSKSASLRIIDFLTGSLSGESRYFEDENKE